MKKPWKEQHCEHSHCYLFFVSQRTFCVILVARYIGTWDGSHNRRVPHRHEHHRPDRVLARGADVRIVKIERLRTRADIDANSSSNSIIDDDDDNDNGASKATTTTTSVCAREPISMPAAASTTTTTTTTTSAFQTLSDHYGLFGRLVLSASSSSSSPPLDSADVS